MTESETLDNAACRNRQTRLIEYLRSNALEGALLLRREHVQWLTGVYFAPVFEPAVYLSSEGACWLAAPRGDYQAAADHVVPFDAKWRSTLRNDQRHAACLALAGELDRMPQSAIGVEFSQGTRHFPLPDSCARRDVEPMMFVLRRRKDADELALMRRATLATERMYQRAREILRPGLSELAMYNALHDVAVDVLQQPPTGYGNDFRCNARGGPPRPGVEAEAGQLYVLDLGPAYQGYYADNARTLAVADPSDAQFEAWRRVLEVFQLVEEQVRPGTSCKQLFEQVQTLLDQAPVGVFNHHLGHGLGLFPHEAPHLNPHWDDQFEVGDVFTVEPGLYAQELRAGMRLENNYRVTATGVELLTEFPLELRL